MPLNWIELASGQKFDPTQPKNTRYKIQDIAPALSKICRYNGQTKHFYSVAEHSVHIARYLKKTGHNRFVVRTGLLHDASEAYLGDIVVCLKHLLPLYQNMEHHVNKCLVDSFGLQYPFPDIIHEVDKRILVNERQTVMRKSGNDWPCDTLEPLPDLDIRCWGPIQAEQEFMETFRSTQLMENSAA